MIAVTCASRFELFGMAEPGCREDGELRFRNPGASRGQGRGAGPGGAVVGVIGRPAVIEW